MALLEPTEPIDSLNSGSPADPQAFVSQLLRRLSPHSIFSARQVLEDYPDLVHHHSCVLDLAYEEFCRLRDSGDTVSPTEFAARYPQIEQSLHRVIEFDQVLHQHPSLVESVPDEHWPTCGQTFCGCQLREQIGRGVLSRVFVAQQERLGNRRIVAKICARGEQEASLLGRLNHPAIAAVYSIDTDPATGLSLICMPYLTRVTLHHLVEVLGRRLPDSAPRVADISDIVTRLNSEDPAFPEASSANVPGKCTASFTELFLTWARDLAQALEVAHRNDVLHCDVKPGNVLLLPDLSVQLLDFNLASSASAADRIVGGTMPYMASEQLRQILSESGAAGTDDEDHLRRVCPATDVYGLSATLWQLATGAPPFGVAVDAGDRNAAANILLSRQMDGLTPESVSRAESVLPRSAVKLLQRGLDEDPRRRPQTALEMGELLQELLQDELQLASGMPESAVAERDRLLALPIEAIQSPDGFLRGNSGLLLMFAGLMTAAILLLWPSITQLAFDAEVNASSSLQDIALDPVVAAEELAVQQAMLFIQQHQFAAAREVLARFVLDGSSEQILFLDLYCESVLLKPPFKIAASSAPSISVGKQASAVEASAELLEEWNRVSAAWEAFSRSGIFRREAIVNAAAMQFEIGELGVTRQLLDELDASPGQFSAVDRMQLCMRLLSNAKDDSEHDVNKSQQVDLDILRQRRYATLSRFETWTLVRTLAWTFGAGVDLSNAELLEQRSELAGLIGASCGTTLEPIAFRPILFEKAVAGDSLLNSQISRVLASAKVQLSNQLPHLLVLPGQ